MSTRRAAVLLTLPLAGALLFLPSTVQDEAPRGPAPKDVSVAAVVRSGSASPEVRTWKVKEHEVDDFVASLEDDPEVVGASTDAVAYATLTTSSEALVAPDVNDPRLSEQWALTRLDAGPALAGGGAGVGQVVAVLDTGVDGSHPDLAGVVLPGADFVSGKTDGRVDDNGHGTHVAGIIAAQADNGIGVAGLAHGVRILPVKVLNADGEGPDSEVAKGVIWATDNGADVINMSLGSTENVAALGAAVDYARSKDVVVVAAMGNSALEGDPTIYPAAYHGVLAVAATSAGDMRALFSSSGPHAGVSAPGVSILSTFPGDQYAYQSGTSMAAPYAAAGVALVRQSYPRLTEAQVVARVRGSAQDLGPKGQDDVFGAGMIDPLAARTDGKPRPAPASPGLPTLPSPSFPDFPGGGGLPSLPAFPNFPGSSLPGLPSLPDASLPDLPDASLPNLPRPSLPAQPGLPQRTMERMVLGINSSAKTVAFGSTVTITGNLGGFGTSNVSQPVEVLVKPHGAKDFVVASRSKTDSAGRVAFTATPAVGADFALRFGGAKGVPAVTSRALHVDVASSLTLDQSRRAGKVVLTGKVTPPRSGAKVVLERLEGTVWKTVTSGKTRPDGSFTFTQDISSKVVMYRTTTPAVDGLVAGTSGKVSVSP